MDLLQFIAHLGGATTRMDAARHAALERSAKLVEAEAKRLIGEYQDAAGPFPPWADLADRTKDERTRLGFPEDEPGLRTGEMRDSISHRVERAEAVVGSNNDKMVYFELGTVKQPPRSVLGGALVRNEEHVARILGEAAVAALIGSGANLRLR